MLLAEKKVYIKFIMYKYYRLQIIFMCTYIDVIYLLFKVVHVVCVVVVVKKSRIKRRKESSSSTSYKNRTSTSSSSRSINTSSTGK